MPTILLKHMLASHQRVDLEKTVKWLHGQENPGISYWTLREVHGMSDNDPEVRSYQDKIASFGPVRALLDEQHSEGYWGEPEGCYWPGQVVASAERSRGGPDWLPSVVRA